MDKIIQVNPKIKIPMNLAKYPMKASFDVWPPKDPGGSALYHNGTHAAGFLNGAQTDPPAERISWGYHGIPSGCWSHGPLYRWFTVLKDGENLNGKLLVPEGRL